MMNVILYFLIIIIVVAPAPAPVIVVALALVIVVVTLTPIVEEKHACKKEKTYSKLYLGQ